MTRTVLLLLIFLSACSSLFTTEEVEHRPDYPEIPDMIIIGVPFP